MSWGYIEGKCLGYIEGKMSVFGTIQALAAGIDRMTHDDHLARHRNRSNRLLMCPADNAEKTRFKAERSRTVRVAEGHEGN